MAVTLKPDQVVPAVGIVFGLCACLFGSRFTRLYCFVIGCTLGTSIIYWMDESQIAIRNGGVPLIMSLLISLFSGLMFLLLHMLSLGGILAFTAAAFVFAVDNGFFFDYYRQVVYVLALLVAVPFTLRYPNRAMRITTAASGALLLTLGIDSYATRSFGALIFQDTFLECALEVQSSVARCFSWRCWILLPFWIVCATCGYFTQHYAHKLHLYEQAWPLLFVTPKRANFTTRTTARQAATESLLAEDRSYNISNYSGLESYQRQQQAQQQVQQAQQAALLQQQQTQPSAAPELGSAHADDKVSSVPAARASFNFLEARRLPAHSQYLYLVIHNAFQGLVRTYGFQADNMANQYEHLVFLLTNYQSHTATASGSETPTRGASGGGGDHISQLHTKLFSNYREWIAYMSTHGVVKSQIAEPRVDKNTTDQKIEEICLWLLTWGEAGSLRHTPECLIYLFHSLVSENRRYQARFGGGFLDSSSASSYRPRRRAGDFLAYVITPIYEVMAKEAGKPDGVRKNYDDMNEMFWRKSCLSYYYADAAYRVDAAADIEAGASAAAVSSTNSRSSISISVALAGAKKSFLEKRSWLHPARSFMRLISFYGVCFHLLVAIAYIHYANLPMLGAAANKILSSFVISVAAWSVVKEALEVWATYGIISESVWNAIGFVMRVAIKVTACACLAIFYTWSTENYDPVMRDQYYGAYVILSCLYLIPLACAILAQLFPVLGHQLQRMSFVDTLLRFWYPINRNFVGRDIHEPEAAIYRYQVFWVLLLLLKMYLSLLFQVSPLIQPTIDLLDHINTLSISTKVWVIYANYLEIGLMWLPFILVYLFDTVIYYFLWQAIMGVCVGMNLHLGEIRAFSQLIGCFSELPKQFDRKIVFSRHKLGVGQPASKSVPGNMMSASPPLMSAAERESLLTVGASGQLVANCFQQGGGSPIPSITASPNLIAPLSTARGRRGSLTSVGGTIEDPFRNRATENFAVVWNEVIEDMREGDLLSNAERGLLRFRFDTTSEKEYYLPLFLVVGHLDSSIDRCVEAHADWKRAMASTQGGLDSAAKTKRERALFGHFASEPMRRECVAEMWEHLGWLLSNLLGERHIDSVKLALKAASDLFITHQHVLRGSNLSALPRVKQDLLTLVRGLRIASASFATLRLAEAERDRRILAEREREEREELDREEAEREELEDEAEAQENEKSKRAGGVTVVDESSDSEPERERARRSQRKGLIRDAERSSSQGFLARAREAASLLKSPSSATLSMLSKIHATRPAHARLILPGSIDDTSYLALHISLIRDQLSALLNSLASCLDVGYNRALGPHSNHAASAMGPNPDVQAIVQALKGISLESSGFMWNDTYAAKQIHTFLKQSRSPATLSTMHALLTIAAIDAEPKNSEAVRRLLFFANSLHMDLPIAPAVRAMKSLSTLTPFHSEDIIYSYADLDKRTEDGVSVFLYLQTIYPLEWQNFLERCGISEDAFNSTRGGTILSSNKKWNLEARLWATMRGQTLGRTVDGMMLQEKALKLLLKLEEPDIPSTSAGPHDLDESSLLVQQKYQYVISCQVYGKQRRENDSKAADIEFLLHRYPSLRVAYIDSIKVQRRTPDGQPRVTEEFYSVLIKSERSPTGAAEIKEVYRIRLPGNPILGEGKPENQNHAMIFTRGEVLQTIDMNMASGLEEALKMRNLLEEFNVGPNEKRVGIVGFREHIYTGGLSSIAHFMALQEGCFVTQGQRVLDTLRVRFHYGHPDCFDKLFFMSRGGVSKASKGINLSEDIFAGFNSVLRGGSVKFREYIQCGKGRDVGLQQLFKFEAKLAQGNSEQSISRDIYRIANSVDFFRLLSFFFGGVGFYITNTLTIWALFLFIYIRLVLGGFRLESLDSFSGADTVSYWFGMLGFLLTIPIFSTIGLERGFRRGLADVLRMVITGGPLFYLFHIGTKSYYFEQTLLAGGALYRPTGRGFVTRHEDFAEIYRFHANSHFYRSVEMLIALLLYRFVIPVTYSYGLVTWAAWMIVVAWLFSPFWFNPLAFELEKTLLDLANFSDWMSRKEGDGNRCWRAWWKDETAYLHGLQPTTRLLMSLFQVRYFVVASSLIYFAGASRAQVGAAGSVLAVFLLLVVFIRARISLHYQYIVRAVKAIMAVALLAAILYVAEFYTFAPGASFQFFFALIALTYVVHAMCNIALVCGLRFYFLGQYFKLVDWVIAGAIFLVLGLLSVTVIPGIIQTRLMFYNAFSRGVLIDKLLRTKPDDGQGSTVAAAVQPRVPSRRRKDARSRSDGSPDESEELLQSPEASAPTPSSHSMAGFGYEAMNFIERRGGGSASAPRKKLHPSKQESAVGLEAPPSGGDESLRRSKKGAVTFAPRKAPSFTSLDDLPEQVEPLESPQPPEAGSGTFYGTQVLQDQLQLPTNVPTKFAQAMARSAGSTPIGGPAVLPMYPSPVLNPATAGVGRLVTIQRSSSDHLTTSGVISPTGGGGHLSLVAAHSGSNASLHSSGSSGRGSPQMSSSASPNPAPSSPHLGATASLSRRGDKMVSGLPPLGLHDERPIPKTVLPPAGNSPVPPQFPSSVTESPLNPRRA